MKRALRRHRKSNPPAIPKNAKDAPASLELIHAQDELLKPLVAPDDVPVTSPDRD